MNFGGENNEKSIQSVIDSLVKDLGWQDDLDRENIRNVWEEVAGKTISTKASVNEFKNGILEIITESPTWRSELFIRRGNLKDSINEKLGKNLVREVIVKLKRQ